MDDREFELRTREIELEAERVEIERLKSEQLRREASPRWSSPLVVAIFAGVLTLLGNATVSIVQSQNELRLETTKAELSQELELVKNEQVRILEMITTGGDPEQARKNLRFLLETGLISDEVLVGALESYFDRTETNEFPSLFSESTPRIVAGEGDQLEPSLVLNMVSDFRARLGLRELKGDPALQEIAQKQANLLASQRTLKPSTDGDPSLSQQIRKSGYEACSVGKNVAQNDVSARSLFQSWLNSPGHRRNMTQWGAQHGAVANSVNLYGEVYWVMLIARPCL